MGRRGQLIYKRTVAAVVLTLVAVAVPSIAWFLAGTRNLERQAESEQADAFLAAHKKGSILAERLRTRLDRLLRTEERRPFYHYQNLFHDPRGASAGAAVSVSPLAQGSTDPLIEAHFQVDDQGLVSLPTLNEQFPELSLEGDHGDRCALLAELSDIGSFCSFGDSSVGPGDLDDLSRLATSGENSQSHWEVMAVQAWDQHLRANDLYANLKYGKGTTTSGAAKPSNSPGVGSATDAEIQIEVSPFSWFTLPVSDELNLVALRHVETPEGLWTQGFVMSLAAVEHDLENSYYPASFVPRLDRNAAPRDSRVVAAVEGIPWAVELDVSANLQQTVGRAVTERQRFFGIFLIVALGAGLAGVLVILMVLQSERLAQQRAHFAASAAHELRTPLAGLRLYGEMLAEGLGDPQQSQRYARRVASEAERLGRVVTNVLSYTRLERSAWDLHPQPGDLGQAVQDAYKGLRPVLDESGAEMVLELSDDVPPVLFDRDAMVHIVQNLLDNAEKYTRDVVDRRIQLSVARSDDHAQLAVTDNGHGIPADLRKTLFRPFQRGDSADAPEGLGLGLMLVRTLVRAQGGKIRYSDAPLGGAVFTVELPLAT